MTTESRIREVLEREGFEVDKFGASATLVDDLGMDSLDTAELVIELEKEFKGLEVGLDEEDSWGTILDVVQYVDKSLSHR